MNPTRLMLQKQVRARCSEIKGADKYNDEELFQLAEKAEKIKGANPIWITLALLIA